MYTWVIFVLIRNQEIIIIQWKYIFSPYFYKIIDSGGAYLSFPVCLFGWGFCCRFLLNEKNII